MISGKIYTKKGDTGMTSLFGGLRVEKNNLRVATYGSVDELNSLLGVVIAETVNKMLKKILLGIQNDLLDIGSCLANPDSKPLKYLSSKVEKFENSIDEMTEKLPELHNFILPGGGKSGAFLHFARSVSRRVERSVVELAQKEKIDKNILTYFNRLSDLLFTMSRFANMQEKQKEIKWNKKE